MLTSLNITNFGLIDKVSLEFDAHLNILTGETGAGKSILIDALRCCLGERLDSSYLRNPALALTIEAVFDIQDKKLRTQEALAEFLQEGEDQIIIQRSLTADGKSKIKINGLTVTVGQLRTVGNYLIDFHGPHDHQMLLDEAQHMIMLDQLVDFKNTKDEYTNNFHAYEETLKKLRQLTEASQTRQRDLELLEHQVKELENISFDETHYQELLQEQTKINNAERLHEHIQSALSLLDDEDAGANTLLRKAFSPLKSLTQIDEHSSGLLEQLSLSQEQISDLTARLQDYADSLDFDAKRAQEVSNSCDRYDDIKRKYGPSLSDAHKFYEEARTKYDLIKNFAQSDQELRQTLKLQETELNKIATKITKARQKAGEALTATIEKELKDLGINHVRFEAHFTKTEFNKDGADKIAFYISPNAGEDLKPLAQIVSSGEAARVMLALKKALIKVDPIPVLIFDEIDAQIGGRLGTITGKKLKELSLERQVILITHLPQIASFGDKHLKVIKTVKDKRAITEVVDLDKKQRVDEIAQMMSGTTTTKIALSHAQDMLATAQKS